MIKATIYITLRDKSYEALDKRINAVQLAVEGSGIQDFGFDTITEIEHNNQEEV